MKKIIKSFLGDLEKEKKASKNTIESYERDLRYFNDYLDRNNLKIQRLEPINIIMFLNELKKENKSVSTLNRTLSSVNSFIKYAYDNGHTTKMISLSKIAVPKMQKKEKTIFTKNEIKRLREAFEGEKVSNKRDKFLFELMYTAGLKPTDIINLKKEELNLDMGYVTVTKARGKEEIKNLSKDTLKIAESYMTETREEYLIDKTKAKKKGKKVVKKLVYKPDNEYVFLNKSGDKLTRQSVWKVMKKYADIAEVSKDVTSNVLHDSYLYHKADDEE